MNRLQALIKGGADVNAEGIDNRTPKSLARTEGMQMVIKCCVAEVELLENCKKEVHGIQAKLDVERRALQVEGRLRGEVENRLDKAQKLTQQWIQKHGQIDEDRQRVSFERDLALKEAEDRQTSLKKWMDEWS